jgi:hypothetical protein
MPRKSAASLAVVRPEGRLDRLRPPADLGEAEQQVWRTITQACDPQHFQASDAPLLRRYVENVMLAGRAAEALATEGPVINGRLSSWLTVAEKADRALVALSMRLRISPQARMRREGTAPKGAPASVYSMMDSDYD